MKPLVFVGSSRDDLRGFPAEARRAAGFELGFVQQGLEPSDWKSMTEVGAGVREIRIHVLGEWRVLLCGEVCQGHLCPSRLSQENTEDGEGRHYVGT